MRWESIIALCHHEALRLRYCSLCRPLVNRAPCGSGSRYHWWVGDKDDWGGGLVSRDGSVCLLDPEGLKMRVTGVLILGGSGVIQS